MDTIKRKPRVVHVMKDLGLGGTQKTAELFCRHLATKHQVDYDLFVIYNAGHELTRYQHFNDIVGQDRFIPYRFDKQGIELLQAIQPDLVHVYRAGNPEWPIPGRDIKHSVFVETNVFGFLDPNPLVHKTLFMSSWLKECVRQQYGEAVFSSLDRGGQRFDFINNPVDLPATPNKMDLKLSKNTIVLGRCGRPDDGIYDDINVKAAMILMAKGHDIFFLVMAPPPRMVEDLEKYSIPYLAIPPTVDPVVLSEFYNSIDILAHARADGETFGSNIAEAMIHGKPVVTHIAVPSHPGMGVFQAQTQLVIDSITGYVAQHNSADYAECLEKLVTLDTLRFTFGRAGKAWAEKFCTTEVCGEKLHQTYQNALYRNSHILRS
jgi:glycosyltransferase involved in cell wall biosynthesis